MYIDTVQPLDVLKSAYKQISSGDCVNIIQDYKFWFWIYSTYAIVDTEEKRSHIRNTQIKKLDCVILNDIYHDKYRSVKCQFELIPFPEGVIPKFRFLYMYEFTIYKNQISITQCTSNIRYKKTWLYRDVLDELERLILLAT